MTVAYSTSEASSRTSTGVVGRQPRGIEHALTVGNDRLMVTAKIATTSVDDCNRQRITAPSRRLTSDIEDTVSMVAIELYRQLK